MNRQRFEFTQETMDHLRKCRAAGITKTEACLMLKVSHTTVDRAAKRVSMGTLQAVKRLYPHGGSSTAHRVEPPEIIDGMRKLKPEHIGAPLKINMGSLYVRAASMAWRQAA